jgi:hypothetical protein
VHIALVTDYYAPTLGGVQTAVRALAESLRAAGGAPRSPDGPRRTPRIAAWGRTRRGARHW